MKNKKPEFDGPEYDPALDDARLTKQMGRVYACMIDGRWRTLSEIREITSDPEASISAQLRHLRKPRFGGYMVRRRRRGEKKHGLFEYQLLKITIPPNTDLFPETFDNNL